MRGHGRAASGRCGERRVRSAGGTAGGRARPCGGHARPLSRGGPCPATLGRGLTPGTWSKAPGRLTSAGVQGSNGNKAVLLVEDDEDVREAVEQILVEEGFQ